MQHKNMVLSREQLLVQCWGYDYEGEARAVDTQIKRLREKLGRPPRASRPSSRRATDWRKEREKAPYHPPKRLLAADDIGIGFVAAGHGLPHSHHCPNRRPALPG